jgi:signal transduction histidine kinase
LALNGSGIVLYALAVVFVPPPAGDVGASPTLQRGLTGVARHQRAVGAAAVAAGILLSALPLRWLGFGLLWPVGVVAGGLVVVWSGSDQRDRDRWRARASRIPGNPFDALHGGWAVALRLGAGAVLVIVGLGVLVSRASSLGSFGQLLGAALVTLAGLVVVVGPWIRRLWRALSEERRARVRSEERAEVAAHLHDSVLQTLAMVQRNPATPREVAALARRQERDLRAWLYPGRNRPQASLASSLGAAMAEVEDVYDIRVHLVIVGDARTDSSSDALVSAAREAAANAAVHAGVAEVSVYAEADEHHLEVYVRDRGKGFDPQSIADDRRGVRDSIVGRMRRHGGTAVVNSTPGEGTEIVLGLDR